MKDRNYSPAFSCSILELIPRSGCRFIIAFFFHPTTPHPPFALPPAQFAVPLVLPVKTFTYLHAPSIPPLSWSLISSHPAPDYK